MEREQEEHYYGCSGQKHTVASDPSAGAIKYISAFPFTPQDNNNSEKLF